MSSSAEELRARRRERVLARGKDRLARLKQAKEDESDETAALPDKVFVVSSSPKIDSAASEIQRRSDAAAPAAEPAAATKSAAEAERPAEPAPVTRKPKEIPSITSLVHDMKAQRQRIYVVTILSFFFVGIVSSLYRIPLALSMAGAVLARALALRALRRPSALLELLQAVCVAFVAYGVAYSAAGAHV